MARHWTPSHPAVVALPLKRRWIEFERHQFHLQPTPDMKSNLSLLIAALVCFTAIQAAPHSLR
jgi:hypothetical protein